MFSVTGLISVRCLKNFLVYLDSFCCKQVSCVWVVMGLNLKEVWDYVLICVLQVGDLRNVTIYLLVVGIAGYGKSHADPGLVEFLYIEFAN